MQPHTDICWVSHSPSASMQESILVSLNMLYVMIEASYPVHIHSRSIYIYIKCFSTCHHTVVTGHVVMQPHTDICWVSHSPSASGRQESLLVSHCRTML